MKKSKLFLMGLLGVLPVFSLVLTGCPTSTPDIPTVSAVTVSPKMPGVVKGNTRQFTATVTGTNSPDTTVTWSVEGKGTGSDTAISDTGLLDVAANETVTTLIVRATSLFDTSKSGTATVTVYATEGEVPTVTSVSVIPLTENVAKGGTKQFNATVTGTNSPSSTVTWSVTGGGTGTNINDTGLLTVAANETATTLTVKATSAVDDTKYGTATVTVYSAQEQVLTVSVTPATPGVVKGETEQFNATVTGPGNPSSTVTWTVEGNQAGGTSIDSTGLLTVAANETAPTLTVKATYTGNGTTFGAATVTVYATEGEVPTVTGVSVAPLTASVAKGDTKQFTATVTVGANNPAQTVTWTVEGKGPGSSTAITDGLLAVAANETAKTLTVKATSTVDAAKYGTATVTVLSPSSNTPGFTFTGIDSQYNGQYAVFRSASNTAPEGGDYLLGGANITASGITGVRISGGSVTIPIYLVYMETQTGDSYNGSDTNIKIYLNIKNLPSFTFAEVFGSGDSTYTADSVTFTNGSASVNLSASTSAGKTLVITNISADQYQKASHGFYVGIFKSGTSPEQALSEEGMVAGADYGNMSGGPLYTATVLLYAMDDTIWMGSGTFDVYLMLVSESSTSYYRKEGVSFTTATTTVSATEFASLPGPTVEPPPGDSESPPKTSDDDKTPGLSDDSPKTSDDGDKTGLSDGSLGVGSQ